MTHEFWLPDGSKFAYVYRETTGDKIENIRLMDPETLKEEILMPCSPFAHFICDKKNEYMVGDSQGSDVPIHLLTEEMLKEKANTISNDFIYLIDVKKRTEKKLCYHGTSWLSMEIRRIHIRIRAFLRTTRVLFLYLTVKDCPAFIR